MLLRDFIGLCCCLSLSAASMWAYPSEINMIQGTFFWLHSERFEFASPRTKVHKYTVYPIPKTPSKLFLLYCQKPEKKEQTLACTLLHRKMQLLLQGTFQELPFRTTFSPQLLLPQLLHCSGENSGNKRLVFTSFVISMRGQTQTPNCHSNTFLPGLFGGKLQASILPLGSFSVRKTTGKGCSWCSVLDISLVISLVGKCKTSRNDLLLLLCFSLFPLLLCRKVPGLPQGEVYRKNIKGKNSPQICQG